jgi:hypothetical protein
MVTDDHRNPPAILLQPGQAYRWEAVAIEESSHSSWQFLSLSAIVAAL